MRRLGQHLLHALFLFWLTLIFPSKSITEKEILLEFKGNVSSDPYKSLISWDFGRDPCLDFDGVHCNSDGYVDKIVLWNSSLAGALSPALSGLKSIRVITLFGNRFTGNIPSEYAKLSTLWKINVSSNSLLGSIPEFLGDLPNLRFLDLSKNGFSGEIPSVLFTSCGKAKFISLSHNNLSGLIPATISNCVELAGFDVSFNNLSGGFQKQVCEISSLAYLSVRSNALSGGINSEHISACQSLELLDLGSNNFSGSAPFEVLELKNITYLDISHNKFSGDIPLKINSCSERLQVFDVSGNDLNGEIPISISNCINLKVLDLGFNKISGSIPSEIGNLKRLSVISLANNSINGTIPSEFGSIELLQVLDLHNLNLVGEIPDSISNCRFLLELDVSGNELEGEIPQTLYNMTYLEILDLHRNRFNGTIPSDLGSLSGLKILDLSQNSLSGSIPSSLVNLTLLTHFNLSSNNLSGIIPLSPVIQDFGPSAFFDNPGLCGSPLNSPCATLTSGSKKSKKLSVSAIIAIVAAGVILFGVFAICIMNIRAQNRKKDDETSVMETTPLGSTDSNVIIGKLVLFSKSLPSKYEDWEAGTKALLDKDCLIGGGSIGTVYKANFENEVSIAVKKLETLGRIRNQDEFELDMGRLGNLQHPNLVTFQGYYWSTSMQLILSEFVPNGNLYDGLHRLTDPGPSTSSGSSELFWSRRFNIALGTARAVAYLHHDCKPQIINLNIKSTNILLDINYGPKLSDYGLMKLLPIIGSTKFHNAVGYVAPELAQSLRLNDKCDVYSFGVVLLELVTGRKPVERISINEVIILCEYVRELLESGNVSDCFDKRLRGFDENEVIQVMKLGLICTSEDSLRRPSMAEAVQVLESIRSGSEA